jgi:hypothetical protein
MEVQLLTQSQIKSEFKNIVQRAIVIKGTVAYWTWDRNYIENEFGSNFFVALKHIESFFCIDISSTVSIINNIASCSKQVDNFYIYTYKFKVTKIGDENRVSLLHSKITYIETADGYFVFLGSHNNTKNAFNGLNMEHSVLIKFPLHLSTEDTQLLDNILFQLNRIKSFCYKFIFDLVDFYKGLQIIDENFLPRIVLKFDNYQINDVSPNKTISVISFNDLIPNGIQYDRNIKDKKILVAICNDQEVKKIFIAYGEADDKVAKYEMDEKVTESDFIALSINGFSDPLGIPYLSFNTIKNRKIKGSSLNFSEHVIHRFKIIEEIVEFDRVRNFINVPKKISFYREVTETEFNSLHLGQKEFNKNDILKIDSKKHNLEYLRMEKCRAFSESKSHVSELKYNTDIETVLQIDEKLRNIFNDITNEHDDVIENRTIKKFKILSLLSGNNNYEDNLLDKSYEEKIIQLQENISNYVNDRKNGTKIKNKLGQFNGKYYILTHSDLNILKSNNI